MEYMRPVLSKDEIEKVNKEVLGYIGELSEESFFCTLCSARLNCKMVRTSLITFSVCNFFVEGRERREVEIIHRDQSILCIPLTT